MKRLKGIIWTSAIFLILYSPISAFAELHCNLPCNITTPDLAFHIKEVGYPIFDTHSLWFKLENNTLPLDNVIIEANAESPLLLLDAPLFNPINIKILNPDAHYIFQHYYEETNANEFQIHLSWNQQSKSYTESIIVNLDTLR